VRERVRTTDEYPRDEDTPGCYGSIDRGGAALRIPPLIPRGIQGSNPPPEALPFLGTHKVEGPTKGLLAGNELQSHLGGLFGTGTTQYIRGCQWGGGGGAHPGDPPTGVRPLTPLSPMQHQKGCD